MNMSCGSGMEARLSCQRGDVNVEIGGQRLGLKGQRMCKNVNWRPLAHFYFCLLLR